MSWPAAIGIELRLYPCGLRLPDGRG